MSPKKTKEKIEWSYKGQTINKIEQTPENSFAFIYKITLEDGRYYVGKKYMWKPNYTSGKNKGKSKGKKRDVQKRRIVFPRRQSNF